MYDHLDSFCLDCLGIFQVSRVFSYFNQTTKTSNRISSPKSERFRLLLPIITTCIHQPCGPCVFSVDGQYMQYYDPCDGWTTQLNHTVDDSEIPNNHLGCMKHVVNIGVNYQPQLARFRQICSINSIARFGRKAESSWKFNKFIDSVGFKVVRIRRKVWDTTLCHMCSWLAKMPFQSIPNSFACTMILEDLAFPHSTHAYNHHLIIDFNISSLSSQLTGLISWGEYHKINKIPSKIKKYILGGCCSFIATTPATFK